MTATGAPYGESAALTLYGDGLTHGGALVAQSRSPSTMAQRRLVERELTAHFSRLPLSWGVNVMTAQPADIVVFVSQVWVPHHGRTLLTDGTMSPSTANLRGVFAALAHLFERHGRGGDWSLAAPFNNPCRSALVSDCQSGLERHVNDRAPPPVAAHPLTEQKLLTLVSQLDARYASHSRDGARLGTPYQRMRCLLSARDALLFVYLFHSLQRGVEGARIGLANLSLPGDRRPLQVGDSRLLTARTVRVHTGRQKCSPTGSTLEIPRADDERLCFMRRVHHYSLQCADLGLPLEGPEYLLFRASDPLNRGAHAATTLSSSACLGRLKQALTAAGVNEGETVHSCRRGGIQDAQRKGEHANATMARANIKTPGIHALYASTERPTRRKPVATPAPARSTPEATPRGACILQ